MLGAALILFFCLSGTGMVSMNSLEGCSSDYSSTVLPDERERTVVQQLLTGNWRSGHLPLSHYAAVGVHVTTSMPVCACLPAPCLLD